MLAYLRLLDVIFQERLVLVFVNKISPSGGHLRIADPTILQLQFEVSINGEEKNIEPATKGSVRILKLIITIPTEFQEVRSPIPQEDYGQDVDRQDIQLPVRLPQ